MPSNVIFSDKSTWELTPTVDIGHLNNLFEKLESEILDLKLDMKQVKEKLGEDTIRIDFV